VTSLGAAEIARAVRAGELDAVETVEQALATIEQRSDLNALITVCGEQALARGRAGVHGPLAGVPLLVKDVIDTAGIRTTAGSRIYADRLPEASAPAVLALEAAGAVVLGKTNCDEFAWGVTGQNAHYGDARNPLLPGRITGGSSSGNAAALAAGLAPLALGTDTGGSVRMPAGCCQVVGLKPRLGALPMTGVFPLCPSFDTVGPMARTVEDGVLCLEVLTGERLDLPDPGRLRAGFLAARPPLGPGEPAVEHDERGEALAARLDPLGLGVAEVALRVPPADLWPVFYAEAAAVHRDTFPSRSDEYGPGVRTKLENAQRIDSRALEAGRHALAAWRRAAEAEPAVDVIVSPTLGVREIPAADVDELALRVAFSAYTRAFSFLGWPAIAIGEVQLAARRIDVLLSVALAWERAYGPPGAAG
jgi:aspartyl-tRNA(Asn)/glutamyl-tRNA(Gln) amidotransferase subunit A